MNYVLNTNKISTIYIYICFKEISMKTLFLKRFQYYKDLADKTFEQLTDEQLFWQPNAESNSVSVIAKHLTGNMISRWTNFLAEDGEKSWRHRDEEFINDYKTRQEMLDHWEKGWKTLFDAVNKLSDENQYAVLTIRDEKTSFTDALLRQLAHYPYHIGQMVYLGKMMKNHNWKSLSVPRGKSEKYNQEMITKLRADEQQNASPVCFAKSVEVRDDYKI